MYSFFCYPDRSRLRVSQVLVLPPFQRQGVGRGLLQAVYALADTRNALDVTVRRRSYRIVRLQLVLAQGTWLLAWGNIVTMPNNM